MKGIVYQSTGSWYKIKLENGDFVNARLKGKLRLTDTKTTNPVAVGDFVEFSFAEENSDAQITEVLKRDNYIIRSSPRNPHKNSIIASNIDQSILLASMRNRRTPLGFIDRFLVSSEMYHIPTIIVFNKKDIYRSKDFDKYEEIKKLYESLGYACYLISAEGKEGIEEIVALLKNKTSLVSGQSGVGKSSLMNAINVEWEIMVRQISKFTSKGQHTTTYATMYDLDESTKIIDSPGIKMLKLIEIQPEEIWQYFPEFKKFVGQCKFDNCVHLNEPKCAVLNAFDKGEIAESRFVAYENIYEEVKAQNYWERES